jgi:aspartyl-tRNA(Asn)/glutamyl-tRNA(Gln) amidotransferase subunit A
MTIAEAARRLRAREISSEDLTRESLRIIDREQPRTNAFITVTGELALAQARAADNELARGVDRGPLQGIPYALKDLFETCGVPTTGGSKILAGYIPARDAAVVEKLRGAGAVLVGKTGMQEFAYGITCNNPHYGAIRNPHDLSRIPGGSSGGSGVAVANGSVFFAMGSDTGGSIRNPATYCGCVGLKPTLGRVSRFGALPLAFSLDHMGPLTRTVHDAALVLNAIAGHDPRDDSSSRRPTSDYTPHLTVLNGIRIGVPRNFYRDRIMPGIAAAYDAALRTAERLGACLVELAVPDPEALNTVSRVILLAEALAVLRPHLHRRSDFGIDVLALLDQGQLISAADYIDAQRLRRSLQRNWNRIWTQADCLFTPSSPIVPPRIGDTLIDWGGGISEDVRLAATRFLRAFNVLGWPVISIPLPSPGLPVGLQIAGPAFSESALLQIAFAQEKGTFTP